MSRRALGGWFGLLLFGAVLGASGGLLDAQEMASGKWALVVAAQRYPEETGFASIKYAERDGQELYDLLVDPQRGGYQKDHVSLMTTAPGGSLRPERNRILNELRLLAQRAREDSGRPPETVLVYFSGHGMEKGGENYLIPVDAISNYLEATAVPLSAVEERLKETGARQQIVIVDACRSQTFAGKAPGGTGSVAWAKQKEAIANAKGLVMLASCSEGQVSYEDDGLQHSAFTGVLLQGLAGGADLDPPDGIVTILEAYNYSRRELKARRDRAQQPYFSAEQDAPDIPLVRAPRMAALEVNTEPQGAEIWVDEEMRGKTPGTVQIELAGKPQRKVTVAVRKDGFDEGRATLIVTAGERREAPLMVPMRESAKAPPALEPADPKLAATTLSRGIGEVRAIAIGPGGKLFSATASGDADQPPAGIYAAEMGQDCDPEAQALGGSEPALVEPSGLLVHPDGRVVVADSGDSRVWSFPLTGAPPVVLTDQIPGPHGLTLAPPSFRGKHVKPGDVLVCASSPKHPQSSGLYVIDGGSRAVRRLVGPPELPNGLVQADFGPDGLLYAMEDDAVTASGITVVSISAEGRIAPVVTNFRPDPTLLPPISGPLAVHPISGHVFFAYGATVYEVDAPGAEPTVFARQGTAITALEFDASGALLVGDSGQRLLARIAPCAIEGRLLMSSWAADIAARASGEFVEFGDLFAGSAGNRISLQAARKEQSDASKGEFDLSPVGDEVAYSLEIGGSRDEQWDKTEQIWRQGLAGGNPMNLSERAGTGGINCLPLWSPDGLRLAFRHVDPQQEIDPCRTGFEIWVMNSDGSGARGLAGVRAETRDASAASGSGLAPYYWWAPNSDRLLYRYGDAGSVWSIGLDETDRRPFAGTSGNLSPDGSRLADEGTEPGVLRGERGVWRQLRLSNPDGSGREIVFQHFVKDSDVVRQLRLMRKEATEARMDDVRTWAGPRSVTWSPRGDRLAFLAARSFLPQQGIDYKAQLDLWIYDCDSRALTKVADGQRTIKNRLSWRGPNTYPGSQLVTLGDVSILFSQVTAEGVTVVTRLGQDDAAGRYRFGGRNYSISTSAEYAGPVTIRVRYGEAGAGSANPPSLERFDAAKAAWEDITSSRDPAARTVSAVVDRL